jgi:hypothetical protein
MGEWIEKFYVSLVEDIYIKKNPHDNGCPMFGLVYRPALGIDINIKTYFKPILPQVIPMGEIIVWWTNFCKRKDTNTQNLESLC